MSIKPATDEWIAHIKTKCETLGRLLTAREALSLIERIEYDQECIASLKAERSALREQLDSWWHEGAPR